jgi:hypothetical protein
MGNPKTSCRLWVHRLALAAAVSVVLPTVGIAGEAAEEPDPFEYFELLEQARNVNEGELHFLDRVPDDAHQHRNLLKLDLDSLHSGWVRLEQCHERLDDVAQLEIRYRAERIRDLRIESSRNVARAWVEGPTVQLEQIGREASICISAESRALTRDEFGDVIIRNGPFMRRFLDGYYPMRVELVVEYPVEALRYVRATPEAQPGMRILEETGRIRIDATFEGRLTTEVRFCERTQADCA